MAIQTVAIGTAANDGLGDNPRTGITKVNSNFTDPANAASKLVGTAAGEVPLNSDLGAASLAAIGLLAGNVLGADSINSGGDVWGAGNVEYGTNANGAYWKYPDGLLICKASFTEALTVNSSIGAIFFITGTLRTFPNAFLGDSPAVYFNCVTTQVITPSATNVSLTSCRLVLTSGSASHTSSANSYVAIGRWK
jgi:hypothetical protein